MCQVLFWVLEMQLTTHTFFCPHEASILGEDTHNKRLSNTMQSSNNCSEGKIKQLKMVESSQDLGTILQGGWAREGSSEEGTFELRPEKKCRLSAVDPPFRLPGAPSSGPAAAGWSQGGGRQSVFGLGLQWEWDAAVFISCLSTVLTPPLVRALGEGPTLEIQLLRVRWPLKMI